MFARGDLLPTYGEDKKCHSEPFPIVKVSDDNRMFRAEFGRECKSSTASHSSSRFGSWGRDYWPEEHFDTHVTDVIDKKDAEIFRKNEIVLRDEVHKDANVLGGHFVLGI